jgi:hypothetical protein
LRHADLGGYARGAREMKDPIGLDSVQRAGDFITMRHVTIVVDDAAYFGRFDAEAMQFVVGPFRIQMLRKVLPEKSGGAGDDDFHSSTLPVCL